MSQEEFELLTEKLRGKIKYLYFHLMGEPLCHPELEDMLNLAGDFGFRVIITTNGVLLPKKKEALLSSAALHKVNISLHAFEANDLNISFDEYLKGCLDFGKEAAQKGEKIVVYRLWNNNGLDSLNEKIKNKISECFKNTFDTYDRRRGITLAKHVFLEYGDKFDWPDLSSSDLGTDVFCYGLRDQLGILCNGTVVPCCLDAEGDIALGNVFQDDLDTILSSSRAKALYDGFSNRCASEELCRKCSYATRFKQ